MKLELDFCIGEIWIGLLIKIFFDYEHSVKMIYVVTSVL